MSCAFCKTEESSHVKPYQVMLSHVNMGESHSRLLSRVSSSIQLSTMVAGPYCRGAGKSGQAPAGEV